MGLTVRNSMHTGLRIKSLALLVVAGCTSNQAEPVYDCRVTDCADGFECLLTNGGEWECFPEGTGQPDVGSGDGGQQSGVDASGEVGSADAGRMDLDSSDVPTDTETAPDAIADTTSDAGADTARDTTHDIAPEPDVAEDAPEDAPEDLPPDETTEIELSVEHGLIDLQGRQSFPSIIGHLFDRELGGEPLALLCATLTNQGDHVADVRLGTDLVDFGSAATTSVTLGPGETVEQCGSPNIRFAALAALSSPDTTELQVWVEAGDEVVAEWSVTTDVLPVNAMPWTEMAEAFVAGLILPNHRSVRNLQDDLEHLSRWGEFGFQPYQYRGPVQGFTGEIVDGECFYDNQFLAEGGDRVDVTVTGFDSGSDIDLYLVDSQGEAVTFFLDAQDGDGVYATLDAGWYSVALCSPPEDIINRRVYYERATLPWDIATDYLQAIFGLLRQEGINYASLGGRYYNGTQPIRRPDEVLEGGGGNCIDGALLFASFLELYGLEPIVALSERNGHAFVGVRADHGSDLWVFIETTLVGDWQVGAFEAIYRGMNTYVCWAAGSCEYVPGQVQDPEVYFLDVVAAREYGILAQPQ
jgi:hypothetical protein